MKFPFHVAADGRSATPVSLEDHIRDEIMQLLLTNQGERPFLPDFGGGLRRLVFERNDDVAAGLSKAVITQAITQWLGSRVKIENLQVSNDNATLAVDLVYRVLVSDEVRRVRFERGQ